MPVLTGTKWGQKGLGNPGGVVTWSIAGAGEGIGRFGNVNGRSLNPDTFLNFDYEKVISDAFAAWSSFGNIEFIRVEDGGGSAGANLVADIRIFFGNIPGSIIGWAYFPTNSPSAIAGDILLDSLSQFNTDRELFRGLVLHEIGHALGLDHTQANSIMRPIISGDDLEADDMAGIRQIYGAQDGADPVYNIRGGGKIKILDAPEDLIVNGNARNNVIVGSDSSEDLNGRDGRDTLKGNGGDDSLNGGAGNDMLLSDAGADTLNGGSGVDRVDYKTSGAITLDLAAPGSGSGDALGDVLIAIERIFGSNFDDLIFGDASNNFINGRLGDDTIRGRDGDDILHGHRGNDVLDGGDGNDDLNGSHGRDLLQGMDGQDTLRGRFADDTLEGGAGNDVLAGGSGRDVMDGGTGDDRMIGGSSGDRFVFVDGHGNDTIVDFTVSSVLEALDFSGLSSLNSLADVRAAATNTASGVLIDTGGGDSILLSGVRLGALSEDEFLF